MANVRYRTTKSSSCESIARRIHFSVPAPFLSDEARPWLVTCDFQVTCRICNKPLKLGNETAADEEGKAAPKTYYTELVLKRNSRETPIAE